VRPAGRNAIRASRILINCTLSRCLGRCGFSRDGGFNRLCASVSDRAFQPREARSLALCSHTAQASASRRTPARPSRARSNATTHMPRYQSGRAAALQETSHPAPRQSLAKHGLTISIHTVHLKHALRDVQTDRRDFLNRGSPSASSAEDPAAG
jgi:hypothetical protein